MGAYIREDVATAFASLVMVLAVAAGYLVAVAQLRRPAAEPPPSPRRRRRRARRQTLHMLYPIDSHKLPPILLPSAGTIEAVRAARPTPPPTPPRPVVSAESTAALEDLAAISVAAAASAARSASASARRRVQLSLPSSAAYPGIASPVGITVVADGRQALGGPLPNSPARESARESVSARDSHVKVREAASSVTAAMEDMLRSPGISPTGVSPTGVSPTGRRLFGDEEAPALPTQRPVTATPRLRRRPDTTTTVRSASSSKESVSEDAAAYQRRLIERVAAQLEEQSFGRYDAR